MNKKVVPKVFLAVCLTGVLLTSCGGGDELSDKTNLISDVNWIDEKCNTISFKMPDELEYTEGDMAHGICENDDYCITISGSSHAELLGSG